MSRGHNKKMECSDGPANYELSFDGSRPTSHLNSADLPAAGCGGSAELQHMTSGRTDVGAVGRTPVPAELSQYSVDTLIPVQ